MTDQLQQQVSAFVDNELPEEECSLLVRRLSSDSELQGCVNRFALIGDAMRGELLAADVHLGQRISAAVGAENHEGAGAATRSATVHWLKPLSGIAVAATVAAVAVLSLQGFNGPDNTEFPSNTVAVMGADGGGSLERVNLPKVRLPAVVPASAMSQSQMDKFLIRHRGAGGGFGGQSVMGMRDAGSYTLVPVPATTETQDKTGVSPE